MRHFRAARAVTPLARGVGAATTDAPLIAPPGFTYAMGTRLRRTLPGAVGMRRVEVGEAEQRYAAAGAKVASSRGFHRQARKSRWVLDRVGGFVKYFSRNVARLGTGRDIGETCRFGPVSRLLPSAGTLSTAAALRALLQHPGEHPPACPEFPLPHSLSRPRDGWDASGRPPGSLQRPRHRFQTKTSPIILLHSPQSAIRRQQKENGKKTDAEEEPEKPLDKKSKKIDKEKPPRSNRKIQSTIRTPLTPTPPLPLKPTLAARFAHYLTAIHSGLRHRDFPAGHHRLEECGRQTAAERGAAASR